MEHGTSEGAPSDEELIHQVHQGRGSAYDQLVLRYQPVAYNTAYRILNDSAAAADATQESFLKAYQKLHQYRGRGISFRAWLLRIVINTCYDAYRSQRRRVAHLVRIDEDDGDYERNGALRDRHERPEEYVLRRELGESIRAAIDGLSLDQRTVLVLSDIEGLPYREIAGMIGAPIGTVKSRLARARAHVRDVVVTERYGPGRERRAPRPCYSPAARVS